MTILHTDSRDTWALDTDTDEGNMLDISKKGR